MDNKLNRSLKKAEILPPSLRPWLKSKLIGYTVPFVGTAGVVFSKTTPEEWHASLQNKRKIRNHLKQVHASAMVLVAEVTAVLLMASNLPDDRIPLVKKVEADFVRRSSGGIKVKCLLTPEEREKILSEEKGELVIDVIITDETDEQPVLAKITRAWVPKEKRNKTS